MIRLGGKKISMEVNRSKTNNQITQFSPVNVCFSALKTLRNAKLIETRQMQKKLFIYASEKGCENMIYRRLFFNFCSIIQGN